MIISVNRGDIIKNNYEKLITSFVIISSRGWIKGINNNPNSIGLTFEKLLGKKADSLYFPDYYDIEIKCSSRFSRYPIYLFSIAFDGPTFPEINRIVDKYGWYDRDYSDKKVLITKVKYNTKTTVNNIYKFKFEFDKKRDKLFLCVYNMDDKLIEKESFVYTCSLYNHLVLKLKNLAVIYGSTRKLNGNKYFRYYEINIYKLISFDRFIELIESDDIGISLIARVGRSGNNSGIYKNKNLTFEISKTKITQLFNLQYSYNSDTGEEIKKEN